MSLTRYKQERTLALSAVVLLLILAAPAFAEEFDARVYWVVDGDSFKFERRVGNVRIKDECRMLRYNAPEMSGEERLEGRKALKKLMSIIKFKSVKIKAERRDRYKRRLCEVRLLDGTDVNALMRRWLEKQGYKGVGKYDGMEK